MVVYPLIWFQTCCILIINFATDLCLIVPNMQSGNHNREMDSFFGLENVYLHDWRILSQTVFFTFLHLDCMLCLDTFVTKMSNPPVEGLNKCSL